MKGTPATYLGRIVDKEKFRTFVYGAKGEKRLVESWDEYEAAMESGIWFATVPEAVVQPKQKPKPKSRSKVKSELIDELDDVLPNDDSVFEVKDGFLPNETN